MDEIKHQCGNCKQYELFLKQSKGKLKVMSNGRCKLLEIYKTKWRTCRLFEAKII